MVVTGFYSKMKYHKHRNSLHLPIVRAIPLSGCFRYAFDNKTAELARIYAPEVYHEFDFYRLFEFSH